MANNNGLLTVKAILESQAKTNGHVYVKNDLLLDIDQFIEFNQDIEILKTLYDGSVECKIGLDKCSEGTIAAEVVKAKKASNRVGIMPITDVSSKYYIHYHNGVNIADLNDYFEIRLVKNESGKYESKSVHTGYSFKLTTWNQQSKQK